MRRLVVAAVLCVIGIGAATAGTDPTNGPSIFVIDSIGLHPGSFEVTLVVNVGNVSHGTTYGIEAHTGQPTTNSVDWTLIGTQIATESTLVFTDHLSGPLLHPGKTYRGVIDGAIYTVNEAFVGYPRLRDPKVVVCGGPQSNRAAVAYAEGIYSNTVSITVPDGVRAAFFRMWSPDDDPANAVIQVCTNGLGTNWTTYVTE